MVKINKKGEKEIRSGREAEAFEEWVESKDGANVHPKLRLSYLYLFLRNMSGFEQKWERGKRTHSWYLTAKIGADSEPTQAV